MIEGGLFTFFMEAIMSRESMANYWILKGFNSEAVAIFYFEEKRTPEMTKIINNCRNTEEALLKITEKMEATK